MFTPSPIVQQLADGLRPALSLTGGGEVPDELLPETVERHRVGSLLLHAASIAGSHLSETAERQLSDKRDSNVARVLQQKAATVRLRRLFAQQDIAFAEFKGWRLGELLYGGEALRHSKDVDLLVDPARIDDAIALVAGQGYLGTRGEPLDPRRARAVLRFHREVPIRDPQTGAEIELHTRLLAEPPPGWSDEELFDSPRDLSSPAYVLYLLLHGAGSQWKRLKWLCDLAMIAQLVVPDVRHEVAALARHFGCVPALTASFRAGAVLWGEKIAAEWLAEPDLAADTLREAPYLAAYAAALNRMGPMSQRELLLRRLELKRDPPLFGDRQSPRVQAIARRGVLWFLRKY